MANDNTATVIKKKSCILDFVLRYGPSHMHSRRAIRPTFASASFLVVYVL